MQIPLNGDGEYEGGRLVFATAGGSEGSSGAECAGGFEAPRRPAGSATIHTHRAVHGVSALARGTRYGLYLCHTKPSTSAPPPSPKSTAVFRSVQSVMRDNVSAPMTKMRLAPPLASRPFAMTSP